jgi:hypothetical protein
MGADMKITVHLDVPVEIVIEMLLKWKALYKGEDMT